MRLRTIYFKTTGMEKAAAFWQAYLSSSPTKQSSNWTEFKVGEVRIALLLNDFNDVYAGSSCVPVFEFSNEDALQESLDRARGLGAKVVLDSLVDQNMQSIILKDVVDNEFELTLYHD
jgi:hypothetical protein